MAGKKILLLFVITLIASALIVWTFVSFDFRSPFFAFLINWLVMSWAAIAGQFIVFPLFPAAYYEIKPFEKSGRFYERLGVSLYKKIVRRAPFTLLSPTLRFSGERTFHSLRSLENEMCKAETSHLVIFLLMFVLTGYALFHGWLDAAAWLLLFNILFNGYPVTLQRYNRLKIEELMNGMLEYPQQKGA